MRRLITGVMLGGLMPLVAGCSGDGDGHIDCGPLPDIELSPPAATIPVGATQAFVATVIDSRGARVDVSLEASWPASINLTATERFSFVCRAL